LALLLLARPAAVHAQFSYVVNADDTVTITRYLGYGAAVTVPLTTNFMLVTTIGTNAFENCTWVASVTVPWSVTNIEDYAFAGCSWLTNVTILGNLTTIGNSAFQECARLTNFAIPGTVTSIGDSAFEECGSLSSITIPDSVTSLGQMAFMLCSDAGSITIGNGVTTIGFAPFAGCYALTNVTIPTSVTIIENAAFQQCSSLGSLTIPASVTVIGGYQFNGSGLTNLYFYGNAPAADSTLYVSGNLTVYYLPGTTGWGAFSTNTGLNVVMWNPMIQTGDGRFGFTNNQFGFNITGTNNFTVVVEVCTNLARPVWTPLATNTLVNGLFYFSEPVRANGAGRFYGLGLP
jgi:hypothetical protein